MQKTKILLLGNRLTKVKIKLDILLACSDVPSMNSAFAFLGNLGLTQGAMRKKCLFTSKRPRPTA